MSNKQILNRKGANAQMRKGHYTKAIGRGWCSAACSRPSYGPLRSLHLCNSIPNPCTEQELAQQLNTARTLIRDGNNPEDASAEDLLREAVLGNTFGDDDVAAVQQDLSQLREQPRFAGMSLMTIRRAIDTMKISTDERLQEAPPALKEKMQQRLDALKTQIDKAIAYPTEKDRQDWKQEAGRLAGLLAAPDITADDFRAYAGFLLGVAESKTNIHFRSIAINALKEKIGQVRTDNEEINLMVATVKDLVSNLKAALEAETPIFNYQIAPICSICSTCSTWISTKTVNRPIG